MLEQNRLKPGLHPSPPTSLKLRGAGAMTHRLPRPVGLAMTGGKGAMTSCRQRLKGEPLKRGVDTRAGMVQLIVDTRSLYWIEVIRLPRQ